MIPCLGKEEGRWAGQGFKIEWLGKKVTTFNLDSPVDLIRKGQIRNYFPYNRPAGNFESFAGHFPGASGNQQ